jgi:Zn-dependent protease with chaperone function
VTHDARTVTGFFSVVGVVTMVLAAVLLAKSLEDGSSTGVAWAALLLVLGALGLGVGVVVLGVTLAHDRDQARR